MKLFQPHVHTDHRGGEYIGISPEELADAVASSPLDALAITPQLRLSDEFVKIRTLIRQACDQRGKEPVKVYAGVEAQMKECNMIHHVGIVFPEEVLQSEDSLPADPGRRMTLTDLDRYLKSHPGSVSILCHPLWKKPEDDERISACRTLLMSGVFHGVEVHNLKHPHDTSQCRRIAEDAKEAIGKLAFLGGSDASHRSHLTRVLTGYEGDDPLDDIRRGTTFILSDENS